ncbi:MAG TPA: lysozyme inhibitor LprI family protein [Terracidiphilus sp.]|nr:lysozyme inhibitor LprI family protein [Terracidiphilus sp.]
MRTQIVAVSLSAILCLAARGRGQQNPPTHRKVLTPEQQAYQQELKQYSARRQQLEAQAKQIFDTERASEEADVCSGSTYEMKVCYGKHIDFTEESLKIFEATIRDWLAPAPQMPGEPATPPSGPAGPILTAAQEQAELDKVELAWRQYRESACAAAFHQYDGGTLGPIVEAECYLRLARNHMLELNTIYGLGRDH